MKMEYKKPQMRAVWLGLSEETMQNGVNVTSGGQSSGPEKPWGSVREERTWSEDINDGGSFPGSGSLWDKAW